MRDTFLYVHVCSKKLKLFPFICHWTIHGWHWNFFLWYIFFWVNNQNYIIFCVASVEFYSSFLDTHHSGFTSFPLFFFGSPYKHTSLSFHHFNIHFLCLVSIKTASNHWKVCHLRGEHLSILEMDYWSWIQNLQRWWTEGKDRWVEKPNESLEGELMRLVK